MSIKAIICRLRGHIPQVRFARPGSTHRLEFYCYRCHADIDLHDEGYHPAIAWLRKLAR